MNVANANYWPLKYCTFLHYTTIKKYIFSHCVKYFAEVNRKEDFRLKYPIPFPLTSKSFLYINRSAKKLLSQCWVVGYIHQVLSKWLWIHFFRFEKEIIGAESLLLCLYLCDCAWTQGTSMVLINRYGAFLSLLTTHVKNVRQNL